MSTNASGSTAHFGLSQWAENDRILREDFNHDNAAIDAALKQQQDSIATQIQSALGQICVQKLYSQSLSADSASVTIDLSGVDLSQYAQLALVLAPFALHRSDGYYGNGYGTVIFNGDSGSNYFQGSKSSGAASYLVLDGNVYTTDDSITATMRLWDANGRVHALADSIDSTSDDAGYSVSGTQGWRGGGLSAIRSIKIGLSTSDSYLKLKAGSCIYLYGWKK